MPEIVTSLITHLRANTAIAALVATRVDPALDPAGDLPAIAVVLDSAVPVGQGLLDCTVALHVRASTRADATALCELLRAALQDKYHYLLAPSTADELLVVHSVLAESGGVQRHGDDGPWAACEKYRMVAPS